MAAKIKKGDKVIVLTGKDKGKTGDVLQVFPTDNRVLVSGVNIAKRHTKAQGATEGGIIDKNLPIHISNVALRDPKSGKPTRVGFKTLDGGKKARVAKRSGEVING
ncbi:MAG: 50S ribosomal protein L24 [Pseudomonadota bacterium]|jgi:large subunit ribosomal protein L24|nr:50S ribosomal protein L24 [Pseudomonadota bacterium]